MNALSLANLFSGGADSGAEPGVYLHLEKLFSNSTETQSGPQSGFQSRCQLKVGPKVVSKLEGHLKVGPNLVSRWETRLGPTFK